MADLCRGLTYAGSQTPVLDVAYALAWAAVVLAGVYAMAHWADHNCP